MSFLKSLGHVLGKGLQIASPVLAATGVGAPLAAGAMLAGRTLDKATSDGGIGKMKLFKDGILPAAGVGAGAALVGHAGGGAGILEKLKGVMGGHGSGPLDESTAGIPEIGGHSGSFLGDIGKNLLKKLSTHPEIALGAVGAIQNARMQGKAADLTDDAAHMAQQNAADMAPLRAALLARMQQPQAAAPVAAPTAQAPDLSALIARMPKPQQFSFQGR
jgi:hypothetical protein